MFEHSLIDLEAKQQPRGRRWISLPIAVALHLVGLTAFAFASYWTVGAVQEPTSLNTVFFELTPPPAPPGGGGGRPKPVDTKPVDVQPKPEPTQPVQPTDETVPDTVPKNTASTPVDDVVSDLAPGNDSGSNDLPVGPGYGPGPVGPGAGPGPGGNGDGPDVGGGYDEQPIRLTADMVKPEILQQVQPRYTEVARRAGIQGTVIMEAVIDEKGYVTDVRVLRGLPMGLDRAATEAIQQWRFKPATLSNRPVKVYFTLTVNFTIQR